MRISGRETELKHGEWFISLAVSPDSKQLAYLGSVRSSATSYLAVMSAEGGSSHEIFRGTPWTGASRSGTLSWTSDQHSLLFVRAGEANASPSVIWRVPTDGGQPERIGISIIGPIKNPQMYADGKQILFSASEVSPKRALGFGKLSAKDRSGALKTL